MAVALEKLMHLALDRMPKIRRARTDKVEWFQSEQVDFRLHGRGRQGAEPYSNKIK